VTFSLTPKQIEAKEILAGDATHIMLAGGSRSGKTFLLVRSVILRAMKADNSRHVIFRFRANSVKASILLDTFPKVMAIAFAGADYRVKNTDAGTYVEFPNGSQIWVAGLDDKDRVEKILGMEFVTVYLNECSQIAYHSRNLCMTRLAQSVFQSSPGGQTSKLKPRMYYDENPPGKGRWTYKLFIRKIDPDSGQPLAHPSDYAFMRINPIDNEHHLGEGYLDRLKGMSASYRKRFLDGEYADDNPNALFTDEIIETWRVTDGIVPDLVRVVVAVDPSGSGDVDNADNDAIGICVAGVGIDGNAYVLEDCTVKAGPATWGRIATSAYDRHKADIIVGEINYGGAMVNQVIQSSRPRTPFKQVTASRGKAVRAEPFSALYENGKVRHVGRFDELEDELCAFSTMGYTGQGSPNRADAAIWALAELFPGLVAGPRVERKPRPPRVSAGGWMG
jgi:Phage terminase large subunit/Terminase RNaseH-like domain